MLTILCLFVVVPPEVNSGFKKSGNQELPISDKDARQTSLSKKNSLWREWEFWLLLALGLGVYFASPTSVPIRGEETRRALIAREMIASGNWVIPTQQGRPRLTKPPLHYWAIAAAGTILGEVDVWAVRLPSLLAILLTAVMMYAYARQFASKLAAFSSAACYLSMVQVMQLGRLGETEALFTLLLSSSLLAWHWAFECKHSPRLAWTLGYVLCALAMLTKGPQAPVYFVGGTSLYLMMSRRWRDIFRLPSLQGAVLACAVVLAWMIPFYQEMGWKAVSRVFVGEAAIRMGGPQWGSIFAHWATFPFEWLGCMLPWSLLLPAYLYKSFRNSLPSDATAVRFWTICCAVALPTVWLPPEARTRYLMPIYPLVGLLAGTVVDRLSIVTAEVKWRNDWRNFLYVCGFVGCLAGVGFLGLSLFAPTNNAALTMPPAVLFFLIAAGIGCYLLWLASCNKSSQLLGTVLALAVFCGATMIGPVQNLLIRRSTNSPRQIAQLRETLQTKSPLHSFGLIHHYFAYHYREPISMRSWPQSSADVKPGNYFCYDREHEKDSMPFAWEEVAVISCDRKYRPKPLVEVIIGRRLTESEAATATTLTRGKERVRLK